ncbi:MAG: lipocalin family protein [Polaribacter sp.]|uniref:lipocalin family protein n=1 Tax=Polaribacter sp. TaxID=1920175 RepID=UPI0032638C35
MKKLLYLFIASTILFSCTTNDDDDSSDPIIGIWQLSSETENGTDISTSCERKSTITFLENGTTTQIYSYEDGNNCSTESDSATWENLGNSNYKLYYGDGDGETSKITFSQNNTVFSVTNTDDYNGTTYTYVITYKKI